MKKNKLKVFSILALCGMAVSGMAACNGTSNSTVLPTPGETTPVHTTPAGPVEQKNPIEMNGVAYATIKEAIAAIPTSGDTSTYTIRLNKGTYKEVGISYNGSATIRIIGNTDTKYGADVIIEGRGSNMSSMRGRELMEIQGTGNIILENISLVSDYSRAETTADVQAEVFATDTKGNTVAYNCTFKSHQDTLRTAGKAWFYGCYVEGDVDFIWMEAAGSVALYEKCEIVSVWDKNAKTHNSYVSAPRMAVTSKVGKGLVFYNSTVKESEAAKENGQKTYLARSPWTSGYYNQVAYINTKCSDIEVEKNDDSKSANAPWYGNMIATEHPQTVVGWKMDKASAASIGLSEKDYILADEVTNVEYNGRQAIINRIYNTGKQRYEKDAANYWDVNSLISELGYEVEADNSKAVLDGEVETVSTVYTFDGNTDVSTICNGFAQDNSKPHYVGQNGATITIPLKGKCFVEVYGYYQGVAEAKADTQGNSVMFFNNYSTGSLVEQDYIVFDANAKEFVLTAKGTTYITKIVVTPDETIKEPTPVSEINISASSRVQTVGVSVTLSAAVNKDATNKSVIWSSSDESIGTIDPYTGKVVFKAPGNVVFTATACDGSDVSATFECNPKDANWTVSEWYTTDSADIAAEKDAVGIENFSVNSSAYKKLGAEYSFVNASGKTITTGYGFKLNSAGKLSIATTKPAVLTIITCDVGKCFATPYIAIEGGTAVTPKSEVKSEDGKTITYVYELKSAGLWDIVRGDNSQENNPILYAKCEYQEAVISSSTGLSFKGTHYTEGKTGIANDKIIYPTEVIDATGSSVNINEFKLTNCKSNGNVTNWLAFSTGAKIEFKVSGACTLLVGYYSKLQTVKLNGEVVNGNKTSVANGNGEIVEYELSGAGAVVIESSVNDYLGFVGVVFRTLEQKQAIACNELDKLYPADKYTQNAQYATVLEAQKAAINAAKDDAALAKAIVDAKAALDALEVDPEPTEPVYVAKLAYDVTKDAASLTDGEAIQSTKEIEFTGCIKHNGTYIALKNDNAVKILLKAGATLTVNMPYTEGVKLNNADVKLDANSNLVYTATKDEEVVITGTPGKAYITTITVVAGPVDTLSYDVTKDAANLADGEAIQSTDEIEFTGCIKHNGTYIALKNDNAVKILLKAGATLTVNMPYTEGVKLNNADVKLDANSNLVYTATKDEEVVITGTPGKAYITTITVVAGN